MLSTKFNGRFVSEGLNQNYGDVRCKIESEVRSLMKRSATGWFGTNLSTDFKFCTKLLTVLDTKFNGCFV